MYGQHRSMRQLLSICLCIFIIQHVQLLTIIIYLYMYTLISIKPLCVFSYYFVYGPINVFIHFQYTVMQTYMHQ